MSNDYNAEHDPAWVGSAGVWRLKEEFETKENPLADDSDVVKDALASIFTLGSIIGYCSGPAGAPIAAALSAGAGILTALKKPENDNELATLLESIQTMQRNDKVNKQVAAVEAYWGWLKIHKDILESTKITKAQSLKVCLNLGRWLRYVDVDNFASPSYKHWTTTGRTPLMNSSSVPSPITVTTTGRGLHRDLRLPHLSVASSPPTPFAAEYTHGWLWTPKLATKLKIIINTCRASKTHAKLCRTLQTRNDRR